MTYDPIAQALAENDAAHGVRITGYGFLGDGAGNVVVDFANRVVNYYQTAVEGNRVVSTAYLWDKAQIPLADIASGRVIEVQLGYPGDNAPLHVLGVSKPGLRAEGGLTPMERKVYQAQFPYATQIQDFRLVPLDGYIEAKVLPGKYIRPSTRLPYRFEKSTRFADNPLTDIQAALASGKHCIAWVFLDVEAGMLRTVASTAETALGTLPARNEILESTISNVSAPNVNCKRLTPVYLYYGQTGTLLTSHILYEWDMRFDSVLAGSGGTVDDILTDSEGNVLSDSEGNVLTESA